MTEIIRLAFRSDNVPKQSFMTGAGNKCVCGGEGAGGSDRWVYWINWGSPYFSSFLVCVSSAAICGVEQSWIKARLKSLPANSR